MKDLKIVLLLGIPILLVVGGLLFLNRGTVPDVTPVVVGTSDRPPFTRGELEPLPGVVRYEPGTVPPGGPPANAVGRRLPPNGDQPEVLTSELLAELLEEATGEDANAAQRAWLRLEQLLTTGVLADPLAAEAQLVAALRRGGNTTVWAAKLIECLNDEGAREKAVRDLLGLAAESTDPQVLKGAFGVLGKLGDGDAVEELGRFARSLDQHGPAVAAIRAIGMIGTPEAVDALLTLLADQVGAKLESAIVKSIGTIDSKEMAEALLVKLEAGGSPGMRVALVRSLGMIRRPEGVRSIVEAMSAGAAQELLHESVIALGRIGNEEAVRELIRLHREGGDLSFAAGLAVGNAEGAGAVGPILEAIDEQPDARVKVRWVEALGNSGSDRAAGKLEALLASETESEHVRGRAALGLARIGKPEAVTPIVRALAAAGPEDRNLLIHLSQAVKRLAEHPAAQRRLVEDALPVLKKLTASRAQDAAFFYAVQARNTLESLRGQLDREPR